MIATVLLIAFAVALGSVVMNWGLNLDLGKFGDLCNNVEVQVRGLGNGDVCFGGFGPNGYINFAVDNTGGIDIYGFAIWITGDKGTSLFDLDDVSLLKGSFYEQTSKQVTYDFLIYGNIKQVQFIPKIRKDNAIEICPKSAVKVDKMVVCS